MDRQMEVYISIYLYFYTHTYIELDAQRQFSKQVSAPQLL